VQKKRFQIPAIALTAFLLAAVLQISGLLTPLENTLWDTRVKLFAEPEKRHAGIKIVLIDQSSLDWAESTNGLSWPWPREMYTAITDYAMQGGAKAVIFDMLFLEPSLYGSGDDRRFAAALERTETIGAVVISDTQGTRTQWPVELQNRVNAPVALPAPNMTVYSRGSFPVEPLASAFGTLGSVTADADGDGVVRRIGLMRYFDGRQLPTLALAAYLQLHPDLEFTHDGDTFCLNGDCQRYDNDYRTVINYRGPSQTFDSVNAAAVIQSKLLADEDKAPTVPADFFEASYVFIGVTAPGLMDLKATPVQGVYPGVEVHATVLDNLISRDFIEKVPQPLTLLLLALLTLFSAAGIRLHTALLQSARYPLLSLTAIAAAGYVTYGMSLWLELAPLLAGVVFASVGAFGLNYFIEGRQRRFIRSAFAQYLSPKVIDVLVEHPERLKLGGQSETLTLFFSDIEGFTKISSKMDAKTLATFLNEYLGLLSDAIMELGGTIDKYEGDAIIAFWNAPLPQEGHAALAVEAALTCQRLLDEHNPDFKKRYGHTVKTRFGIHTGEVVIGNLGTEKRFDYTFIGDAGNLASRLESANKQFGSYIMISDATRTAMNERYPCRELGTISVVGREAPVKVFEPLREPYAHNDAYHTALNAFYLGELDRAEQGFTALAADDAVSRTYLQMIGRIRSGDGILQNGVLKLREK
jgi:adenylate cyclase